MFSASNDVKGGQAKEKRERGKDPFELCYVMKAVAAKSHKEEEGPFKVKSPLPTTPRGSHFLGQNQNESFPQLFSEREREREMLMKKQNISVVEVAVVVVVVVDAVVVAVVVMSDWKKHINPHTRAIFLVHCCNTYLTFLVMSIAYK